MPGAGTLSAGQASDKAAVAELLAAHPAPGDVIADRGYDARAVFDLIAARGGRGHIPTQRDRKCQRTVDPRLYRQQPRRAVLLQAQAVREDLNPIRKDGEKLSRRRPHLMLKALDARL